MYKLPAYKYKPNVDDFKVICQKCGKKGRIGFDDTPRSTNFMLIQGEDMGSPFEYYLCLDCLNKLGIKPKDFIQV